MKLKVLHINTFDSYGGASQVAYELVHNLDAECTLLVKKKDSKSEKIIEFPKNILDKIFITIDKVLWKLNLKKPIKNVFSILGELNFTYRKLRKIKEYQEADIIHLHNIHGNYFDLSALKKIASEKYIVWTLHDMWALTGGEAHTFENENYKKGIGKTPYNNIYPLKNPFFDNRQYFIELKRKIYSDIADKLTLVPVSHWLESALTGAYVYNKKMNIRVNYNGINTAIFQNHKRRNWTKPRLLFFNIDNPFKGTHLFLNILNQIKEEYELTVVGEHLKSNVVYKHIQYINDREYMNTIYNNVDLLVFPSLAESFPLTVLEAVACGTSVIASDAGGIPEVINNNIGYIFKNGNQQDLLDKVNYALKNLTESRQKAEIASQNVENFSLKKSCDGYLQIYHKVLSYDNWKFNNIDIQQMKERITIQDFI